MDNGGLTMETLHFELMVENPEGNQTHIQGNVFLPEIDIGNNWGAFLSEVSNVAQAIADGFIRGISNQPRRKSSWDNGY